MALAVPKERPPNLASPVPLLGVSSTVRAPEVLDARKAPQSPSVDELKYILEELFAICSILRTGIEADMCKFLSGFVVPIPTFSLASIVIAVDVALSSMPVDVNVPTVVVPALRAPRVVLPALRTPRVDVPDTVRLLYVAVPENVGLEEGAANPKALWMAVNSVVNSAPLITLFGSFDGRLSFDTKLVVGVYVMDIRISVFLWKPTVGQWTYIRKAPEGAVVLRPYRTT